MLQNKGFLKIPSITGKAAERPDGHPMQQHRPLQVFVKTLPAWQLADRIQKNRAR
jgi:hypothetical protein